MRVLSLLKSTWNKHYRQLYRSKNQTQYSILSSMCVGGILYNRLEQEFLSPTINLWFYQTDFLKFLKKLPHYLNEELLFIKDDDFDFPVALLDDIKIFFTHYKTEGEARQKWEERKKRIDLDNLFIIMVERDGVTKEDIDWLNTFECKRKIIFTSGKYDYDFCIQVPEIKKVSGYLTKYNYFTGKYNFEKYLNYKTY